MIIHSKCGLSRIHSWSTHLPEATEIAKAIPAMAAADHMRIEADLRKRLSQAEADLAAMRTALDGVAPIVVEHDRLKHENELLHLGRIQTARALEQLSA